MPLRLYLKSVLPFDSLASAPGAPTDALLRKSGALAQVSYEGRATTRATKAQSERENDGVDRKGRKKGDAVNCMWFEWLLRCNFRTSRQYCRVL